MPAFIPFRQARLALALAGGLVAAQGGISGLRGEQPRGAGPAPAPAVSGDKSTYRFFRESVLPVLQQHCYSCHSHAAGKAKGGLVLDSRRGWSHGGDSGPAVVPGNPSDSLLIRAVRYEELEMPPGGKLPPDAVAVLERWVRDGAADPRVTESGDISRSEAGRAHWAFQPLRDAPPPAVQDRDWPRDDADRFLLARLEELGLRPAPDADRHTWLRRVHLDLTGLPPTGDQVEQYVADDSPGADDRVVDRLLDSRAFGERWGRHWLDLVGYADQIGTANDIFAEHAWRYRDYVIQAFAADKPFDRFVREQLAGDLLPYESSGQRAEQLTATGFLLLGDLTVVEADKPKLRVDVVDQQVDKIGRALLGMTLGCARCHDHKFDPISQRDYYGLAGILYSTESVHKAPWGVWSWPTVQELPETEAQQAEREVRGLQHRQRLEGLRSERDQVRSRLAEVDAALAPAKDAAKQAEPRAAADAGRSSPETSALRQTLTNIRRDLDDRLKMLENQIRHAEFFAPSPPRTFAVREVAEPADMQVTIRGNAYALGPTVPRGFPPVIRAGAGSPISSRESGRRQLADWLVGPDNCLTPRVVVNRIWQKLFGEGIVRTVDYFGLPGDRPSHPELLDHLARRFRSEGWSQKRLIRSLVLSRAYRMSSSSRNPEAERQDPENRWFWRMHRRRLDAEALRDSLLLVAGRLVDSTGGPSLPLEYPENTGNLGPKEVNPPFFRLARFRPEQPFQRTVYLPIIRSAPQAGSGELRNYFDFTQPAEFSGQRNITAVPTQALFLMNSAFMKERGRELAERTLRLEGDDSRRLRWLWLRVYSRPPEAAELRDSEAFLGDLRREASNESAAAGELRCWTELCHALLASNEFLMRL